jgi:hydrogenase maturation protease
MKLYLRFAPCQVFQRFQRVHLVLDKENFLNIIIRMKLLLCGMGNKERGDDGFGPYIVENVRETDNLKKIDCNLYPENYLNKIVSLNPDLIIFFDTVKKEGAKTFLLRNDEIVTNNPISVSTHNLPFSAIYQFLRENSKAEIFLLGVSVNSYQELSTETKNIADRICAVFKSIDKQKNLNIIVELYENISAAIR